MRKRVIKVGKTFPFTAKEVTNTVNSIFKHYPCKKKFVNTDLINTLIGLFQHDLDFSIYDQAVWLDITYRAHKRLYVSGKKRFKLCPIGSDITKHVLYDTTALVHILRAKNVNDLPELDLQEHKVNQILKYWSENKEKFWNVFFKWQKVKRKNLDFNFLLSTDGISASLVYERQIKQGNNKWHPNNKNNMALCDKNFEVVGSNDPGMRNVATCVFANADRVEQIKKSEYNYFRFTNHYKALLKANVGNFEERRIDYRNKFKISNDTKGFVSYTDFRLRFRKSAKNIYGSKLYLKSKFMFFQNTQRANTKTVNKILGYTRDIFGRKKFNKARIYHGSWTLSAASPIKRLYPGGRKALSRYWEQRCNIYKTYEAYTSIIVN